ncbi:MAG: hypothetical protein HYR80_07240, partial [Nitrospirae bacterium]|nr:hypothetical protein [Nitrospirota bacterium]
HALEEMIALAKVVDAGLKEICQPILILQSENDVRVHPRSGRAIYERVGSHLKKLISYEKSLKVPHVMTTLENPLLDRVWSEIDLFLSGIFPQQSL